MPNRKISTDSCYRVATLYLYSGTLGVPALEEIRVRVTRNREFGMPNTSRVFRDDDYRMDIETTEYGIGAFSPLVCQSLSTIGDLSRGRFSEVPYPTFHARGSIRAAEWLVAADDFMEWIRQHTFLDPRGEKKRGYTDAYNALGTVKDYVKSTKSRSTAQKAARVLAQHIDELSAAIPDRRWDGLKKALEDPRNSDIGSWDHEEAEAFVKDNAGWVLSVSFNSPFLHSAEDGFRSLERYSWGGIPKP